jgi:HD-GYP domain-containing protein (c-di-GMP phosphodiesterase class II)
MTTTKNGSVKAASRDARERIASDPFCRRCGAPITHAENGLEWAEYGCENCFLASRHERLLQPLQHDLQFALAESLACALDAREHETGLHSKRVACHTLVMARHLIPDAPTLRQVYWGALLHDIGKIGIPDAILLKDGSLSDEEWRVMRTHPDIGYRILAHAPGMAEAAELVRNHEERFDGTGYPRGLAGKAIPLSARIFAIVDTLDAMTSDRPYRRAMPFDSAREVLVRQSGTQFDPETVEVFVAEESTLREMVELKCGAIPVVVASGAPLSSQQTFNPEKGSL